jgi:hypothetical protein
MSDDTLPEYLRVVRDAPISGPSQHTLEKRQENIRRIEGEQGELFALIEDLQRIRDHVNSAPVVGKVAIPYVSMHLREIRRDLGYKIEKNREQLEALRRTT